MSSCAHCKLETVNATYCSYHCELEYQRKARLREMKADRKLVYDGRACRKCGGNMTSEDFRYCSDKCRDEVRERV